MLLSGSVGRGELCRWERGRRVDCKIDGFGRKSEVVTLLYHYQNEFFEDVLGFHTPLINPLAVRVGEIDLIVPWIDFRA